MSNVRNNRRHICEFCDRLYFVSSKHKYEEICPECIPYGKLHSNCKRCGKRLLNMNPIHTCTPSGKSDDNNDN